MDVQIRDANALRRITPVMLRAYLEAHGWVQEETWRNRVLVWSSNHQGHVQEVLTPLREQSDAYAVRISELVAVLSDVEGRSQLDVYYDLVGTGSDIIRLRSLNGFRQSDWALGDSVEFLTRARDLVTAAARFAEHPGKPVYRGRASGMVAEYVRGIRPLPGYEAKPELTLHSQVPAGYGVQEDMGDAFQSPFPRRATIALNDGLREASRTANVVNAGAKVSSSFEKAAQKGVSANFCDAVAALTKQGHGIEINLSWAAVRPSNSLDDEFEFPESTADVFTEGAEWLRRNSPFLDAHVTGEVVRLLRESQADFDGEAVVMYQLDRRPVALEVQFDPPDHEEVYRAFRESLEISVAGDIYREGRRYFLKNPRNFSIV